MVCVCVCVAVVCVCVDFVCLCIDVYGLRMVSVCLNCVCALCVSLFVCVRNKMRNNRASA